jgi:DNA-binding protein H-NS
VAQVLGFAFGRREMMGASGIEQEQASIPLMHLGGASKQTPKSPRKPVEIKYRNEATGDTWTGRGRAPKWLEGKDKNQYLVQ